MPSTQALDTKGPSHPPIGRLLTARMLSPTGASDRFKSVKSHLMSGHCSHAKTTLSPLCSNAALHRPNGRAACGHTGRRRKRLAPSQSIPELRETRAVPSASDSHKHISPVNGLQRGTAAPIVVRHRPGPSSSSAHKAGRVPFFPRWTSLTDRFDFVVPLRHRLPQEPRSPKANFGERLHHICVDSVPQCAATTHRRIK